MYSLALSGMLFALCVPVEAVQPKKHPQIGLLVLGSSEAFTPLRKALAEGLRELGYIEGRNIAIEYRFADGNTERLPALAAELVRLKLDVIMTITNSETSVLKQATTTTPIVMVHTSDPVDAGLIASLAQPGGNITGLSMSASPELLAKRLELLKEVVSRLSRLAILRQADVPGRVESFAALEQAARKLKVAVQFVDVHGPDDFESAFATMIRNRAEGFLISGGPVTWMRRQKIAELAVKNRLPGSHSLREYAEAGLLMTYGANLEALYRRAATYVDKILKGAKPAELPVEQPTKFELVINLKTANKIGLRLPPNVLARADKVIR
jgi:putative ABC transport system substrate-binding protein